MTDKPKEILSLLRSRLGYKYKYTDSDYEKANLAYVSKDMKIAVFHLQLEETDKNTMKDEEVYPNE
jgi:hypothetical protein